MASVTLDLVASELKVKNVAKRSKENLKEKAQASLFEVFQVVKEEVLLMMAQIRKKTWGQ